MKVNPVLTAIIRSEWFIDIHNLQAYDHIIDAIIHGKDFEFKKNIESKSLLSFMDDRGKFLKPDETGRVAVPEGSIALVNMKGEVVKEGNWCVAGADEITDALYKAQEHQNVIGSIMYVDGPGGAVSAMGPFQTFAKYKTKPVGILADQALSLHYYAATTVGDFIIADNNISARFGSIGVQSTFRDQTKYLEEKGIKTHIVTPPESEHKNLSVKLALEGKYDLIKEEFLSPMAKQFQQGVRDTRPKLKEEVGVLTGKTFTAEEALRVGLIDGIGTMQTAIMRLTALSTINSI